MLHRLKEKIKVIFKFDSLNVKQHSVLVSTHLTAWLTHRERYMNAPYVLYEEKKELTVRELIKRHVRQRSTFIYCLVIIHIVQHTYTQALFSSNRSNWTFRITIELESNTKCQDHIFQHMRRLFLCHLTFGRI